MPTSAKRSFAVKINLTPELHERLREVAAQLGQAPSTLAAMAVGQYVANMANSLGATARAVDAVVEHASKALVDQINEQGKQMKLGEDLPVVKTATQKRGTVTKVAPARKRAR